LWLPKVNSMTKS